MKIDELRSLGDAELLKRLEEAHQELFNLRLRMATRQLANHRELPKVKKKNCQNQDHNKTEGAWYRIAYERETKNENRQGNKR